MTARDAQNEPELPSAVTGVTGDGEAAAIPPFAAELLERQPFRGYEISQCLAAGEHTAVFKGRDGVLDRTVAVKAMRPWPERTGTVEEFFSLAGSVARLRFPGVARGLDVGRSDGFFFMVYEFVAGESLALRLARRQTGKYTEKEAIKLIAAIAVQLQGLFELGNPHGHLTPGNVMIAEGGAVRLTDIGFAWTLAWPDDEAAFMERPDCLPPERLRGDLNVDIRGDLYSLGSLWYSMLLGRPVFSGGTPEETLRQHLEQRPAVPRDEDPRMSAATSSMIMWLLEKERDARPRTPNEFLRKLRNNPVWLELHPPAAEASSEPAESQDGEKAEPAMDQAAGEPDPASGGGTPDAGS